MIYTITLNPALDHVVETNGFKIGETNYYHHDYLLIGGKGINVSIILNNLKANVLSTGLLGKENKEIFFAKFNEINLKNNFFLFDGKTRTNFKIKNLLKYEETELNGEGQLIDSNLLTQLFDYLENNLEAGDIVIAAGSTPKTLPIDVYYQLGLIVQKKKAMYILDASKQHLIAGLKAQPFLIKPNLEEICEMLGKPYRDYDFLEIKTMIQELKRLGAQNILLSRGNKESWYFQENGDVYQIGIAQGTLINSVGSGDSMVAGFAFGQYKKFDLIKCLQYGAAAGGATAFTHWLATKEEIENLVNAIKITKLEEEIWN